MRFHLFFLIACCLSIPASARPAEAESPPPCTSANAAPVAIAKVQAGLDVWIGRCVRLRGIAAGGRLYADRLALAEAIRPDHGPPLGSIVIYPTAGARPGGKAAWVDLIGRIGSCAAHHDLAEQGRAEQPDSIIMVGGYCHTSVETYVRPERITRLPGDGVPRLTEAELPKARRTLVQAPAGQARAGAHLAAVRALIAAILAGDEPAFRRLVSPETQAELDQHANRPLPDWLRDDVGAAHRQFAAARQNRSAFAAIGEIRLFVAREALADAAKGNAADYFACGCRTADCSGRWPVTPLDADRDPARPYLCLRSQDYLLGKVRNVVQIDLDSPALGFEEPQSATAERKPGRS